MGRNCICSQLPHCSSIYLLTNLIVLLKIMIITILAWCVDGWKVLLATSTVIVCPPLTSVPYQWLATKIELYLTVKRLPWFAHVKCINIWEKEQKPLENIIFEKVPHDIYTCCTYLCWDVLWVTAGASAISRVNRYLLKRFWLESRSLIGKIWTWSLQYPFEALDHLKLQ